MSTSTLQEKISDPSWVLNPITEVEGVKHALILSADGMIVGKSDNLDKDSADRIAAAISSLQGAARAAAVEALEAPERTPISTITVQLDAAPDSRDRTSLGTLMVIPAGAKTNAYIAAAYSPEAPMGVIAHIMAKQAKNLGEKLMSVSSRSDGSAS
jgi:hypothetical protein